MIITHHRISDANPPYTERRVNGVPVARNYVPLPSETPSMFRNVNFISDSHWVLDRIPENGVSSYISIRLDLSDHVGKKVKISTQTRGTSPRDGRDSASVHSVANPIVGGGWARPFPADGEWYYMEWTEATIYEPGLSTSITFSASQYTGIEYEIKDVYIAIEEDLSTVDLETPLNLEVPDYSTSPPLVYHNGEWQEYTPKVYI